MTASEHPSRRAARCTCGTDYPLWGCEACDDKPRPIAKPVKCAAGCGADTYNIVGCICDTCAPYVAHAAKQLAEVDEYLQAIPVLCSYCMVRPTLHWSMICDACSAMGA